MHASDPDTWPFPARSRTYTRSGTEALSATIQHAGLANSTIVLPAFICRGAFQQLFEYWGIEPRFVDVDAETFQIDPQRASPSLETADAILLVHAFGRPVPMDRWKQVAATDDVLLIEDCARALGAVGDEGPVGTVGDYSIFSFAKVTPLSRGGALVHEGSPIALPDSHSIAPAVVINTVKNLISNHIHLDRETSQQLHQVLQRTSGGGEASPSNPQALDDLTRWRLERYLEKHFAHACRNSHLLATQLTTVLEDVGIHTQQSSPGSVHHVLQAIVPGRRDTILSNLRDCGYPVHAVWTDPWGPATGNFPVAAFLASHVLTFRLREWDMATIERLRDDIPNLV